MWLHCGYKYSICKKKPKHWNTLTKYDPDKDREIREQMEEWEPKSQQKKITDYFVANRVNIYI